MCVGILTFFTDIVKDFYVKKILFFLSRRYYVSRSTLFVHFMCCNDVVTDVFLEEALISVFLSDSYLTEIVIVVPTSCPEGKTGYSCYGIPYSIKLKEKFKLVS